MKRLSLRTIAVTVETILSFFLVSVVMDALNVGSSIEYDLTVFAVVIATCFAVSLLSAGQEVKNGVACIIAAFIGNFLVVFAVAVAFAIVPMACDLSYAVRATVILFGMSLCVIFITHLLNEEIVKKENLSKKKVLIVYTIQWIVVFGIFSATTFL